MNHATNNAQAERAAFEAAARENPHAFRSEAAWCIWQTARALQAATQASAEPVKRRDVFAICDAYESGMGHGLQLDGHKSGAIFENPEHGKAYEIGYEEGEERARDKSKPAPSSAPSTEPDYANKANAGPSPGDMPIDRFIAALPLPQYPTPERAPSIELTGDDAEQVRQIYESARADAAFYVEGHCADGSKHAAAIMGQPLPKITQRAPSTDSAAFVLEQAAQACDQQADGTNGAYRTACLECADAVRVLRDAAITDGAGKPTDAARYRWIREFGYGLPKLGAELDAAIDAAMQPQGNGGQNGQ